MTALNRELRDILEQLSPDQRELLEQTVRPKMMELKRAIMKGMILPGSLAIILLLGLFYFARPM